MLSVRPDVILWRKSAAAVRVIHARYAHVRCCGYSLRARQLLHRTRSIYYLVQHITTPFKAIMTMGGALLMALLMVVFIMFAMRRVCIVSPSQNDENKLFVSVLVYGLSYVPHSQAQQLKDETSSVRRRQFYS